MGLTTKQNSISAFLFPCIGLIAKGQIGNQNKNFGNQNKKKKINKNPGNPNKKVFVWISIFFLFQFPGFVKKKQNSFVWISRFFVWIS
jgi:hypothetical protein